MPAGPDVRTALRRGSDEGGTLGVVAVEGGWVNCRRKKRAERGRKRDERHGRKRVHNSARGPPAEGGWGGHVIGPRVPPGRRSRRTREKPPVSTQLSGCRFSPKSLPAFHPPTGAAAVVSRGLSSSAPSGLLLGYWWEVAARFFAAAGAEIRAAQWSCGTVCGRNSSLCFSMGAFFLHVSGVDEPVCFTLLLDVL